METKMLRIVTIVSFLIIGSLKYAYAGNVNIPNSFQAGQKAVAAEVNANFDAVAAEINDNAQDIGNNIIDISNNTPKINTNSNTYRTTNSIT